MYAGLDEAKVIRDKKDQSHRGCCFLRCKSFLEAQYIIRLGGASAEQMTLKLPHFKPPYLSKTQKEVVSKLQIRYADGELERLGIVSIDATV
jgi:hypothetical protein